MTARHEVPGTGRIGPGDGMRRIEVGGDGRFHTGRDGVRAVCLTGDEKVEFIAYADHTLAYVRSAVGHPAIYPLQPAGVEKPVQAVRPRQAGTLGELEAKPHPWPYAEAARVGLGIGPAGRAHCIGLEDSAAAGVEPLVHVMKPSLADVLGMP